MSFWKKTSKDGKKKPPKPTVPRTAQQSIPMQRMFEDGTCRVKPNYYTRTIAYQDINYQLAQQEDKTAIFEEWCSFLNFFDSSIKFELSFVNMATDSTEFEKSIRIPFQKDGFDDVRAEYSQMLRQQLAKGNNGLTKTKFITFGVEGESMRQVKARLDHIQNDLLNNFHRLGVQANPLNGVQRLKLMHDMFNMDGASKFHFDWKDLVKSGLSVKDAIAPTAFAFKNSRTFQMGGIFGAVSFLNITASDLSDQLLKDFLDMDSSQIVTMHIQSVDQNKYKMQRDYTRLKEVTGVRYADDFKLFTRSYESAKRLFYAVTGWLKGRLGLDISPDKSKIVNLKRSYSEFLGLRIKAANHGTKEKPRYVVESHIREKSLDKIKLSVKKLIHDVEFPGNGKQAEHAAVSRFNSYVIGVHNYYSMATMVCHDLHELAFSVHKSLNTRLGKRAKSAKHVKKNHIKYDIPDYIREKYGDSAQLRFIHGAALAPVGYVKHRNPMLKKRRINSYTPEGRELLHKMLGKSIDVGIMHYLMQNPIPYKSIAYNDNRISLYCAQYGRCAVSGKKLGIGEIHCHHKVPKHLGGTDEYKNLIIVSSDIHRLIHATKPETIQKYLEQLKLDAKQLRKLKNLRKLANVDNCLKRNAI